MDEKDVLHALLEAQDKGLSAAVVTIIRTQGSMPRHAGSKMLVWPDGKIIGTVGGGAMESRVVQDALAALATGQTRIVSYTLNDPAAGDPGICGGTAEMFIEPLVNAPTLLVIGCGHVGKALAELGKWLNFRVIVSDDRADYCNEQHIPGMHGYIVAKPSEVPQQVALGPTTYVAAVTRGLPVDIDLIPALLASEVPYIGLIGSRRRWTLTAKALTEQGITPQQLARVHAPIGLELQAETPQEIAISIMAEIIMLRRGGTGQPMQWTGKTDSVGNSGEVDL
ncbi:MAG: XdhC family protein [Chloroflexota bacterium]